MPTQELTSSPHSRQVLTSYTLLASAIANGASPVDFGIREPVSELPRLKARYRLARSVQGIGLAGYSESTSLGYSALIRIHLTYSVAEKYGRLFKGASPALLLDQAESRALLDRIFDSQVRIAAFSTVRSRLTDGKLKARLEGANRRLDDVLAAFRHTFVHGELSPGAKGDGSPAVSRLLLHVANLACPFVLQRIDEDLTSRVEQGLEKAAKLR